MRSVKELAESKIGNFQIVKYSGDQEDDETIYDHLFRNELYMIAEIGNTKEIEKKEKSSGKLSYSTKDIKYRLPEDYRYYNQDKEMPSWYDFKTHPEMQETVENAYLEAFRKIYSDSGNEELVKEMLAKELGISKDQIISFEKTVNYTNDKSAPLYDNGTGEHVKGQDAIDVRDSSKYRINYYWEGVYVIEEKELQMRQNIHHKRMPVLLVKYCDTWAKSVTYQNDITQNPLDYRNYKYLIPRAKTSLGLHRTNLYEYASYRVDTYKDYFNKKDKDDKTAIKEADVLDMLVQWEEYGNNGNETTYAYMRDLYKLTLFIRESGSMLENAYTYLYIPYTISNFDDATTQKIFWLERLGVSLGEDELNEDEQKVTRTKGNEIYWQNLEYDEYYECITDSR